MPQCICGEHFTTTSFDAYNKESDLCPRCKSVSTPRSYLSSYSWDCESMTRMVLDMSGNNSGRSDYD